jgi:hypothetical protein
MTAQPDARKKLIGAVHAEATRLRIDDDTRRDLMERLTGKRSAADLSAQQLMAVLEAMKASAGRRSADHRPQAAKLRALWLSLWQLGAVEDRSDEALTSFVCRHTGMQAMRWNTDSDLAVAITCLRGWCDRIGYRPVAYRSALIASPMEGRFEPGLIQAQWAVLQQLGAFAVASHHGELPRWLFGLYGARSPANLKPVDAEDAVKTLGAWIRREKARQAV